jgi:hypothetical protein
MSGRITNQRQPMDILREAAILLKGHDALTLTVAELAINKNYANTPQAQVEKIIRTRLAIEGVASARIDEYVAMYRAAKGN